jgi:hypothetical protein
VIAQRRTKRNNQRNKLTPLEAPHHENIPQRSPLGIVCMSGTELAPSEPVHAGQHPHRHLPEHWQDVDPKFADMGKGRC